MKTINFVACGMMGDFIHTLYAVKNICERDNAKANIYLTDNITTYGGDAWRMGTIRAHVDLEDLLMQQPYINSVELLPNGFNEPFINLNQWRDGITNFAVKNGYYSQSWTEFLSECYEFNIPEGYKWINTTKDESLKNTIAIHRSIHRHNVDFPWEIILNSSNENFIFLTCSEDEWEEFSFKNDRIKLRLVSTMSEMAVCINSCKFFIGNQSAPFALASALDVARLVELDAEPAPFYMNESKYSGNISWFLREDRKYFIKQHFNQTK